MVDLVKVLVLSSNEGLVEISSVEVWVRNELNRFRISILNIFAMLKSSMPSRFLILRTQNKRRGAFLGVLRPRFGGCGDKLVKFFLLRSHL